ncbi:MAG: Asp-tRNA(Asn)/Glu-tRNA(Gln) amidotransferase subunit GatA [Myxococcales bacterium]|nr:Asp-tRNA(Asn)/Glu-tRNA(Gln) amidotransferase subunit GatA [Myxococcales bacterium]MCB9577478.1 Asp-tRNA(Asn)/Glu-tRNA(Gln) amidotransferase subunit GatA [Polyangiaceae bacterium]
MTEILTLPAAELARRVRSGELSAVQVAETSLAVARAKAELGAFLHLADDAVLASARDIDARRGRGEPLGALAGVPVAVKDALCTRDAPTTAGSRILTRSGQVQDGWRPPYDATVVARLRAADALIVGKTNMDELAMGSSTENSAFGPARNPWDPTRTPGGSSGGSAVAVAAGIAPLSLGSDTGGSIRQPAAFTGVVGIKPSYGRVPRTGLVAFASSLDQVGPFARDVKSAARLLSVIAGHDARDSTSSPEVVGDYEAACDRDVRGLKVGVPSEYFAEGLDPEVEHSVRAAVAELEGAGAEIVEVPMPHTRYGVATYYVIATAEASSNLARLDGVRFGLRREPPQGGLAAMYGHTRDAGFGAEVKRRILLGTYVLSAGYYDAYYLKAQRVRTLVRRDFEQAFERVDVLATPTSPTPAFALGERVDDPLAMYLADVYTLPASLAGVSALSVPVGPTKARADRPALPVGLQLIAPAFAEERLCTVAAAVERARA